MRRGIGSPLARNARAIASGGGLDGSSKSTNALCKLPPGGSCSVTVATHLATGGAASRMTLLALPLSVPQAAVRVHRRLPA